MTPKFFLIFNKMLDVVCCQHSLPLGSQIITVPVNSSLSWHVNKLREIGKEAYNVSYAWKMVSDRDFACEWWHIVLMYVNVLKLE